MPENDQGLPVSIEEKIRIFEPNIKKSTDVITRKLYYQDGTLAAALYFLEGIANRDEIEQYILRPLTQRIMQKDEIGEHNLIAFHLMPISDFKKHDSMTDAIYALFSGKVLLFAENVKEIIVFEAFGGLTRSISEPSMDKTLAGPKESFVELLNNNVAMIRRKLKDPRLAVERCVVGRRTRNSVAILYISDIAKQELVDQVLRKITEIDIDGILSSGYIGQYLEDNPNSLFYTYRSVERADTAVAELLEGRICILVDQSPMALVVPALFVEMFQEAEDYSDKPVTGSFLRVFRYIAFFIAVFLPSFYLSLISFNHELIPMSLMVTLVKARSMVPFPAVVEVLLLEALIQIIMEAGFRMPSNLGQTIGIVGGIILGQAMVSTGLASPPAIIMIATSTIATYAIPNYNTTMSIRILRVILLVISAGFGLFGMAVSTILLITHLMTQKSIGVPYFAPFAPFIKDDISDSAIRTKNIKNMKKRPKSIPSNNPIRRG